MGNTNIVTSETISNEEYILMRLSKIVTLLLAGFFTFGTLNSVAATKHAKTAIVSKQTKAQTPKKTLKDASKATKQAVKSAKKNVKENPFFSRQA